MLSRCRSVSKILKVALLRNLVVAKFAMTSSGFQPIPTVSAVLGCRNIAIRVVAAFFHGLHSFPGPDELFREFRRGGRGQWKNGIFGTQQPIVVIIIRIGDILLLIIVVGGARFVALPARPL